MIYGRDVQFNEERSEAGQEVFTEEDKHHVELEFITDDSTNDLFEIEVTSNNHENNTPSMNTQPVMRRSERTTRAPVFMEKVQMLVIVKQKSQLLWKKF